MGYSLCLNSLEGETPKHFTPQNGWVGEAPKQLLFGGPFLFSNPKNPRLDPDQKGRVLFQPVLRKVFGSSKRATGLWGVFGFLGVLIVCQDSTYRSSKMDPPVSLMVPQATNSSTSHWMYLLRIPAETCWNQVINFTALIDSTDDLPRGFFTRARCFPQSRKEPIHLLRNAGIPRWDGWFWPYPYHRTIVYLHTLIQ